MSGEYGAKLYRYGVVFHTDGRKRRRAPLGWKYATPIKERRGRCRGAIRAFSRASQKKLEFVAANVEGRFRSHLTLTYHAPAERWDSPERNHALVVRSKADLNRFLSCMRPELGEYLWVQEFQKRGAIHYHMLAEREVSRERVSLAWCRASGALDDAAALEHSVSVQEVESERGARSYLSRYIGKGRQKELPKGVDGAGRWWGRSRGLTLALVDEVFAGEPKPLKGTPAGLRITRCLRRYLSKRLGFKFRSGTLLDWGGELAETLRQMTVRLKREYGDPEPTVNNVSREAWKLLKAHGWELIEPPKRRDWEEVGR